MRKVFPKALSFLPPAPLTAVSSMSEQEREEFLEQFQEEGEETLAGFCVMGGIFSEGIDLAGKKLIGAAIVEPDFHR